jgi:antitoxin component of MazEF toxin-antitoxin module
LQIPDLGNISQGLLLLWKKLRKVGNSTGVTIPNEAIESLGWKLEDSILVSVERDKVVLTKS